MKQGEIKNKPKENRGRRAGNIQFPRRTLESSLIIAPSGTPQECAQ